MVWFRLKFGFRDVIISVFKCQGRNCFVLKVRDEKNIFVKCEEWNLSFALYLNRFKESLNKLPNTSWNPLTRDLKLLYTYNLTDIINWILSKLVKPISIQNLQFEIALLKEEIRAIKEKQELNSLVLQNHATSQSKYLKILPENSTTQDDIEFLNRPELLTKWLVQIKIVIWDD